jgi:hypothetical protein
MLTGRLNIDLNTTIWWHLGQPDVINVCSGDRRLAGENGCAPGLWLKANRGSKQFYGLAKALATLGSCTRRSTDGLPCEGAGPQGLVARCGPARRPCCAANATDTTRPIGAPGGYAHAGVHW